MNRPSEPTFDQICNGYVTIRKEERERLVLVERERLVLIEQECDRLRDRVTELVDACGDDMPLADKLKMSEERAEKLLMQNQAMEHELKVLREQVASRNQADVDARDNCQYYKRELQECQSTCEALRKNIRRLEERTEVLAECERLRIRDIYWEERHTALTEMVSEERKARKQLAYECERIRDVLEQVREHCACCSDRQHGVICDALQELEQPTRQERCAGCGDVASGCVAPDDCDDFNQEPVKRSLGRWKFHAEPEITNLRAAVAHLQALTGSRSGDPLELAHAAAELAATEYAHGVDEGAKRRAALAAEPEPSEPTDWQYRVRNWLGCAAKNSGGDEGNLTPRFLAAAAEDLLRWVPISAAPETQYLCQTCWMDADLDCPRSDEPGAGMRLSCPDYVPPGEIEPEPLHDARNTGAESNPEPDKPTDPTAWSILIEYTGDNDGELLTSRCVGHPPKFLREVLHTIAEETYAPPEPDKPAEPEVQCAVEQPVKGGEK